MECKSFYQTKSAVRSEGINRYIMECKYLVYNYKHKEGCSELIDTLWNVNVFITCSSFNKYAN